ncbi:hypothetical protein DTL42_00740 [Bremerella cremea]|uniref:Glycosyl hydrolase family 98 putative carbohydrate-binding module domain-containing protein n=1 Tax=Bremerella cremea TaxID=1031537 RepID=A0A368KX86_9BACT|nr:NPCBM/NEW2 domain-containing protein [Bremerella cremea]RCS55950.1 hypothetical protein DTL42_00740 [Bremerella cremea]
MKMLCLIMLLLTAATPAVEVQQLDGSVAEGTLVDLTSKSLTLQASDQTTTTLGTKEIIGVKPVVTSPAESRKAPTSELILADDSHVLVSDLQVESRNAKLTLTFGEQVEIGRSNIKAVRFLHPNAEENDPHQESWQKLLAENSTQDAIVLVRDGVLVVQELVIHNINSEGIQIQLDTIERTVAPSKLYGLLFFQRTAREFAAPLCLVHLQDNSTLIAKSVRLTGDRLQISTLVGSDLPIPFSQIRDLDYAAGNIQFLDEMKPSLVEWTPILRSAIGMRELALIYQPRMNESFENEPLQLEFDGQPVSFTRGIAMHATSVLVYDLPSGFRQLSLQAGIAPRSLGMCTAKLQIVGDQKILLEKEFHEDTPPEDIVVNISGVRRLKIIVAALDDEDFGDTLHLCQARLLK